MGGSITVNSKIGLSFGIILLFVLSSVVPMTTGINTDSSEVDVELLSMDSSEEDVVGLDNKEPITPIEPPSIPVVSSGGPMDSAWPMKCHDLCHTSQSPYSTVDTYTEKWRYYVDQWMECGSIIDIEGTIYTGNSWGVLFAINPNGTLKWKYTLNGQIMGSTPAIAEEGTIYIGSWDDYLYAINQDGTLKWKFPADDIASSPAIAEDGTIYFGVMGPGENGRIYGVYPNGTEKWHYDTGYWITSDPAIGKDGTVYIGSGDTYLYAMNPDGTLKWRFKTGNYIKGPPSIADDSTVYIGSYDGYLYALYPNNGTMKWKCRIGDGSETNPSIANDGTIYIGGNYLYAVYPNNGTLKWRFKHSAFIHKSSPAISADGTIFFGTDDTGYIYAVNPDGTQKWRKKIASEWIESSPSIAKDGTVYIGSSQDVGGYLHAFGPQETNDPPNAPTITGPTEGKVDTEYDFTFKSTDPDRNPISFYIEWGDGETTDWTMDYNTGEKVTYSHTWSKRGNFIIKAKAKDTFGLESDWGTFTVTIPRDKAVTYNMLLLRILERFPLLEGLYYLFSDNA